jgi:hypothetical protein
MPGHNDCTSRSSPPAPQQTPDSPSCTLNPAFPMDSGAPSPERNQYSNKESGKVNSGLDFGLSGSTDTSLTASSEEPAVRPDSSSPFASNAPAVDIDFSLLCPPPVAREPQPSLEKLVHRLLHPPPHAFLHGSFSIQWVIGAVGYRHFTFRNSDERWVLRPESGLTERGRALGIPVVLWEWLAGGEDGGSASELGVVLTREFFEGLEREGS